MKTSVLIKNTLAEALKNEYEVDIPVSDIHLEHPGNKSWGDIATNVCFKVAKQVNHSPQEIASKVLYRLQDSELYEEISGSSIKIFKKIGTAGGGFINFTLSDEFLVSKNILRDSKDDIFEEFSENNPLRTQNVLLEYTDPNPFKVFHIGHLMSNAIGESLSRIFEFSGANLKRVNYQGDVGLHVAKTIWGIFKNLDGEEFSSLNRMSLDEKVEFLGKAYSTGAKAYEVVDEKTQEEIRYLNTLVYKAAQEILVKEENWTPVIDFDQFIKEDIPEFPYSKVKEAYEMGKKWSLESFEKVYKRLGTNFDNYYFESKAGEYGMQVVAQNTSTPSDGSVFEEDQGAIIFRGEDHGLHNRVFINSYGLPTYEAKDLGLAIMKNEDFEYDSSYIITASEVNEYFKVVLKALGLIEPDLAEKTTHIGHGMMKLKTGKMSSRTGDVISGTDLLDETLDSVLIQMEESDTDLQEKEQKEVADKLAVGAVKYSILKQSPGKDIVYDKDQFISVTGDTGPYLQYTHARANSVLENARNWDYDFGLVIYQFKNNSMTLNDKERELLRHIATFETSVEKSIEDLSPNAICNYLHTLAQRFNSFYNDVPILSAELEEQKDLRLQITKKTKAILQTGLWLLGIEAPKQV